MEKRGGCGGVEVVGIAMVTEEGKRVAKRRPCPGPCPDPCPCLSLCFLYLQNLITTH